MESDLFWDCPQCWQAAEWEAIISVGNQQLFDGKFKVPQNENISPPIKALHALLCQYFFKQTENNIWSRHSDVKVFYTSCCFQLDIFLRKRIDVAINIPLLLSLPHSITGHHCCQSSLHVASGVDGTAKIWESETGVFNFLLFKSDTGTGKWKCFFPLKTDTGTEWLFQLAAKVSSKLAVILAIQLLGLKWEFKVNFMQI